MLHISQVNLLYILINIIIIFMKDYYYIDIVLLLFPRIILVNLMKI